MFELPPEAQKNLSKIIAEIDKILVDAMPEHVPQYTIMADAGQGFGLVPHDEGTANAMNTNKDKLHPLYRKAILIIKEYNLNFSAQRKREPYILKSMETRTLSGKLVSKKSFDNHKT